MEDVVREDTTRAFPRGIQRLIRALAERSAVNSAPVRENIRAAAKTFGARKT